jgi:hypothetical protein
MSVALGASAYIDVPEYSRAATNVETASLLGLNTAIGGAASVPAGTVTLPVAASSGWAAGPLWLQDGPYSEMVQVTGAPDGTHLALAAPGTRFAHAPGVSASQAGPGGALAEVTLRASAWIEGYCRQGASAGDRSLFAVSRTERWGMPGSRAWLDRDHVLCLRPGHFPVQSVVALALEAAPGQALSLDVAQVELVASGRLIEMPLAVDPLQNGQVIFAGEGVSRGRRRWVAATYTGGIAVGAVPYDVRQACIWVVSELLGQRRNPTGAALVRQGKFELQARPCGDRIGDSLLLVQAKAALGLYREEG